jgi:APA family basic amino acid/polyamine antiporter
VPLIYIAIAGLLILDLAYLAPSTSGIGYLLVLTGVPVYLAWRKRAAPTRSAANDRTVPRCAMRRGRYSRRQT